MKGNNKQHRKRALPVASIVVIMLVGGAAYGIHWMQHRTCIQLDIRGMSQADSASIARLAMPTDFTMEAAIVADRVRRHPWVRWSSATCFPSSVLQVSIEERAPVLLVIDETGRGTHFIDPAGFMMPVTERSTFDVPILRNLSEPYHPVKPVEHAAVRSLAQDLARLDAGTERLLSEFILTPKGLKLYTAPVHDGAPVEVWLGHQDFASRLQWFRSFWDQHIAAHPTQTFHMIDLRFEGQIVTREGST